MRFTTAVSAVVLGATAIVGMELPKDEARGAGTLSSALRSSVMESQLISLVELYDSGIMMDRMMDKKMV